MEFIRQGYPSAILNVDAPKLFKQRQDLRTTRNFKRLCNGCLKGEFEHFSRFGGQALLKGLAADLYTKRGSGFPTAPIPMSK